MTRKYNIRKDTEYILSDDPLEYRIVPYELETLKGWLSVNVGDWITTDTDGENQAIADDVFKKKYKELPVVPSGVSLSIKSWKKHYRRLDQIFGQVYQHELTRTQGSTTINWIMAGNQDNFARAWLDGYVVEE